MNPIFAAAIVTLTCLLPASALASPPAATTGPVSLMALQQGRAAWATEQNDAGVVDAGTQLTHLTVVLKRSAERQAAFEELLRQQQDPASPNFHQWLTPAHVGQRFGAIEPELQAVTGWLESQGLRVDGVSASRARVHFSGTASQVGAAFATSLHNYSVGDKRRIAPASAPQVPAEVAKLIAAVHGLETIHERPHHRNSAPQAEVRRGDGPAYSNCTGSPCTHFLSAADFATIYNLNPAYQQGINGTGQTIAIIGRAAVYLPDIENFESRMGLPTKDPVIIVPPGGIDPGPPASTPPDDPKTVADQSEATLDVTRAVSVAPGATIQLVISKNVQTVGGLVIASEYVADSESSTAKVMSISFGGCEQNAQTSVIIWNSVFGQAAAEGISVFVSSGDSGVAGCDDSFEAAPTNQFASINDICSSSFVTCVGGTQFSDTANPSAYWSTTNTAARGSALAYIPEGAWNEPVDRNGNFIVASTGGGVSSLIAMPAYQSALGLPGAQGRYTPDVSFSASAHDGYYVCFAAASGACVADSTGVAHFIASSGTSASTPSMAGIAALLNQKMGGAQGNLNPRLYAIGAADTNGVFHDTTAATSGVDACDINMPSTCNNSTPGPEGLTGGLAGYAVTPGYDLATGWGSIDVAKLLAHWADASASSANYQGLWWASPANSESGWGINFAHQGDTIFATWFTYDTTGAGNWLVMTAPKTAANTYSGTLYATTGPAFNAVPFNPSAVVAKAEGTGTLTFTDASNGTFAYTIGATSQSKAITREVFGPMPTCATATASLASATNYTDLWWASPANSESGWGINLTHEGTTIFASWFTYDNNGKAMWLVVTAPQGAGASYTGAVYRTTGPAFNSVPFNPANVVATSVGSATFTFSDGNNATFAYTVNGISQVKPITREIFSGNGTVCH